MGRLKTLAQGVHSDAQEPETSVITDERAYAELWERLRDAPARPRVDFERETVIAAFGGRKPSGGHTIEIVERRSAHDGRARARGVRVPGPHEPVSRGASPFSLSSRRASSVFSSDSPIPDSTPSVLENWIER